jgi:hypothetical protein
MKHYKERINRPLKKVDLARGLATEIIFMYNYRIARQKWTKTEADSAITRELNLIAFSLDKKVIYHIAKHLHRKGIT